MADQESFQFNAVPKSSRSSPAGRKPARGKAKPGPRPGSGGRRKSTRRKPTRSTGKPARSRRVAGGPGGTSAAGRGELKSGGESRPQPSHRVTAADLAKQQRNISVSEFFAKNRHLLGFDNPAKGVDNALDACEEAGILPDIRVEISQVSETRFRVAIEDNGPGIVKSQVPKIFGSLLYGSKFHRLRQSRGQQGIGISAAGMYGLLTTGKPMIITTRTGPKQKSHHFELVIDTQRNEPKVKRDDEIDWKKDHGTRVEIELEATYRGGQHSVDAYIRQIVYVPPRAEEHGTEHEFPRVSDQVPAETAEIKPHPYGVELGVLMQMFRKTKARNLRSCLSGDFSRISSRTAVGICERSGIPPTRRPADLHRDEAERIHTTIQKTKIMAPPTDCIAPIGDALIESALRAEVKAEFYTSVSRRPTVYRGNPFLIEVGLAYGGDQAADAPITVYRYANRVPLQYQQGACAITKAVSSTDWKKYQLQQPRGAPPIGPMLLMVHMASVWVPFTSESKESIAHYPEILKEIRLALQECGRKVATHIRKQKREADESKKRAYIEQYIPQVAVGLQQILGLSDVARDKVVTSLTDVLERSRSM